MPTLSLLAPAKLNLFLHITGQRDDGYHMLQTLFQLLDYGDELNFSSRDDGQLLLTPELPGVATADNLIIKAATLLKDASGCSLGADIQLIKRLPMGGGIGGGSSDAATTLVGLNHLWQTGFTGEQLAELGTSLGADIPVFIHGQSAWAEGIGEKLQALELAEKWFLVIIPPCHVSTAHIFSHDQLTRDSSVIKVAAFFEQGGRNDCEPLVRRLYPEVDQAIQWLSQYGNAQMTGTGACVFAEFETAASAQNALTELQENGPDNMQGFVSKGINRSPLYDLLP